MGVLKLEPGEYRKMDEDIRQILVKHGIHKQPACKERLYLPRTEMGRGLHSMEFKSESMLLQLYNTLEAKNTTSIRRKAILKVERFHKSHLSQISDYLRLKYKLEDDTQIESKKLYEAQRNSLYNEIKTKHHHSKLYSLCDNPTFSIKGSSTWLKEGRNNPKDEASLCFLQDRNIFLGETANCPHCKVKKKTVEHLATKCDRMLSYDYTRRHNEVVRCIHLQLCNAYNLKSSKNIRSHSVQEIVSNEKAEIRVDTRIKTDVKIQCNKPDIFVLDKVSKEITLIEVGITSKDNLQTVETEKMRKYDLLANELGLIYKCKTTIIPYVISWDGLVTSFHNRYVSMLGLSKSVEAYIQSVVLKKTLGSISLEYRRGHGENISCGKDTEGVPNKLCLNMENRYSGIRRDV